MPVSPKRKKDGKPVHRAQPTPAEAGGESAPEGSEGGHPRGLGGRVGKPRNPFVEKHGHKGSARGR